MDVEAIRAMVIAHASELSAVSACHIDDRTTFDQLGFDSLDTIRIVVAIEDAFGIDIGCVERMDLETVGHVVDLVSSKTMRLVA